MTLGFILANYWWIVIPGLLLGIYAQVKLKSTYSKYIKIGSRSGMTGAQVAREILDAAGLVNMPIKESHGHLTDHYDPMRKSLVLSSENYHGHSLAAIGVAAHEAGHALQHKDAYKFLQLRMMLVPATQFASMAYMPIFILGIISQALMPFALSLIIGLFSIIFLFQLITLPVEFDASSRAKKILASMGFISGEEGKGVSKVLNAAALTYVAAMVTSGLQLLQFILLRGEQD